MLASIVINFQGFVSQKIKKKKKFQGFFFVEEFHYFQTQGSGVVYLKNIMVFFARIMGIQNFTFYQKNMNLIF